MRLIFYFPFISLLFSIHKYGNNNRTNVGSSILEGKSSVVISWSLLFASAFTSPGCRKRNKYDYNAYDEATTKIKAHTSSSASSNDGQSDKEDGETNSRRIHYLDSNSLPEGEGRPKRLQKKEQSLSKSATKKKEMDKLDEWGVELHPKADETKYNNKYRSSIHTNSSEKQVPKTLYALARSAHAAIAGTMNQKQSLDPNIASNAMSKSILDYRPVGFAAHPPGRDVGRLGIEIDGLRYLYKESNTNIPAHGILDDDEYTDNNNSLRRNNYAMPRKQQLRIENKAITKLSLILAGLLSPYPWKEEVGVVYESDKGKDDADGVYEDINNRPIAIFFNSLKQALLASQELHALKAQSRHILSSPMLKTDYFNKTNNSNAVPIYENVRILCLGQDGIPEEMMLDSKSKTTGKNRRKWGSTRELAEGTIYPERGIILIVQPTDYYMDDTNHFDDNHSNGDTIIPTGGTALNSLQTLLAQASINRIPAIVMSPRLAETNPLFHNSASATSSETRMPTPMGGREQSGGYQKSSTYGGIEPPKGPTPWLLRDFIPPVFSWIGCAVELASPFNKNRSPAALLSKQQEELYDSNYNDDFTMEVSFYSRVAIMQSVMDIGHPWHLFLLEEQYKYAISSKNNKNGSTNTALATNAKTINRQFQYDTVSRKNKYHYMGNTKSSSGRPSREIINDLFEKWSSS